MFRTFGEFRPNPFAFDDSAFFDLIHTQNTFPGFVSDGAVIPAPGSGALLVLATGLVGRRR